MTDKPARFLNLVEILTKDLEYHVDRLITEEHRDGSTHTFIHASTFLPDIRGQDVSRIREEEKRKIVERIRSHLDSSNVQYRQDEHSFYVKISDD